MIIVVFGLPGTGKTFFSKKLSKNLNISRLSTDETREKLGKKGKYDDESILQVYYKMKDDMQAIIKKEEHCIIDGTFHKQKYRDIFKETAHHLNQRLNFFLMQADDDTIKERLKSSRRHSEADYDVYREKKRTFEPVEETAVKLHTDKKNIYELLTIAKQRIYE